LQKYTLHTCSESARSGPPPIVCFHPHVMVTCAGFKQPPMQNLNLKLIIGLIMVKAQSSIFKKGFRVVVVIFLHINARKYNENIFNHY